MRTEEQMAAIITRSMKDLHKSTAHKWGFPDRVLAGATFNLGSTMMIESGYTEEQIEKIWSGNLLRVWNQVETVAKGIQSGAIR